MISKNELGIFENNDALVATSNNDITYILSKKPHPIDSCGDILFLNDSSKLTVKITEITEHSLKYKPCNNIDGPQYAIDKNKIASVIYQNGVKETYTGAILTCMDSLILINGNGMLASIIEVNGNMIKYKSCNDLKGPVRELNMNNIGRIRYKDGRVTNYNQITIAPIEKEKKVNKRLWVTLGAILFVLAILCAIGLVTAGFTTNILLALYAVFSTLLLIFVIAFILFLR